MNKIKPIDLANLRVHPLSSRRSLTQTEHILIDPATSLHPPLSAQTLRAVEKCADRIRSARKKHSSVILIYGAHLLRNGAALILDSLLKQGWITHLATNGAGSIHDWEYAWLGASTESVAENVAAGTFGAWDETSKMIHAALFCGALDGLGYGASLGRFICNNGADIPDSALLRNLIAEHPDDPITGARVDLLHAIRRGQLSAGRLDLHHRWPHASVFASAWRHKTPLTVHPGIGYDIIANHPIFCGSAIGRAAEHDFKLFGGALEYLDDGVVLSIGSAIMGPQVFEKSLSCVNNLRLGAGRSIVQGHSVHVVDLQDGGGWDWRKGEPPKSNPAYYLRFCKSFSRMGAPLDYIQADNAAFIHALWHALDR
jgi:hypothetical protein